MRTIRITTNKMQNDKGFSLVEMLVAVGVFMSIMTIAVSSLMSIIDANKKAQAIKSTIDGVTFIMEDISRDMRIGTTYKCATKTDLSDLSTACLDAESKNIGGIAVRYLNSSGQTVTYIFWGADSNPTKGTLTKTTDGVTVNLISQESTVNINNMKFYVIGADCELGGGSCASRTQPRVVVTASGVVSSKGSSNTTFNLQTTISQRARR